MNASHQARPIPSAGRFALAAALCSSLGQTFFIGLFGSEFREAFGLSQSALGALYGAATLASGLLMFWIGSLADHWSMRRSIALVLAGLATGALVVSLSQQLGVLVIGLFLLRLCGQGLAGHLAVVAAARYARRRGRAVAMVTYGFILGEALLPTAVAVGMANFDWRTVWVAAAALTVLLALPMLAWLAWPLTHPRQLQESTDSDAPHAVMTRRKLFTHADFLRVLTIVLVPPVVVTAVFLHQGTLADQLSWNRGDIASGFLLFAGIQGVFAFAGGRVIDRFSARVLLRFSLLPFGLGLLGLSLFPALSLWVFFAGVGMTAGLNGVISGAIWVELFGSAQLGLIRGVYSALMVISTALGPIGLGLLFDWQISLMTIAVGYLTYAVVVPLLVLPGVKAISAPD
ncbi:MAG: MFS transporter [Pseudomonadota bacterium]